MIPCVMIVLSLAMLLVVGGHYIMLPEDTAPTQMQSVPPTTLPSTPPETTVPTQPPVIKESTATIGSTGDILLHNAVIRSGYDQKTGTYNYDSIFSVFSAFVSGVDYAVANLEVTLCGDDNGYPYDGYPCFNSPDAIVDAAKAAGFDMLLTANNHSYDTGIKGLLRTQQVVADRGLDYIGTRLQTEDKNYTVKEINGIRIGMICYTYNTGFDQNGNASLNDIPLTAEATGLVNSFSYADLPGFYERLSGELEQMREDGAEAIMLYIHWGDEYSVYTNTTQKEMAQSLCDLGIDVIVGNHAHVIQPVELLTNTYDDSRKTLCLYSMGNVLSNIRKSATHPVHCEDGLLFRVTFAKYSDGTVVLESADVLPTWVNRDDGGSVSKFQILAMDGEDEENWTKYMELTEELLIKCRESYNRTVAIVGSGLETANEYFARHQADVEASSGATK